MSKRGKNKISKPPFKVGDVVALIHHSKKALTLGEQRLHRVTDIFRLNEKWAATFADEACTYYCYNYRKIFDSSIEFREVLRSRERLLEI